MDTLHAQAEVSSKICPKPDQFIETHCFDEDDYRLLFDLVQQVKFKKVHKPNSRGQKEEENKIHDYIKTNFVDRICHYNKEYYEKHDHKYDSLVSKAIGYKQELNKYAEILGNDKQFMEEGSLKSQPDYLIYRFFYSLYNAQDKGDLFRDINSFKIRIANCYKEHVKECLKNPVKDISAKAAKDVLKNLIANTTFDIHLEALKRSYDCYLDQYFVREEDSFGPINDSDKKSAAEIVWESYIKTLSSKELSFEDKQRLNSSFFESCLA